MKMREKQEARLELPPFDESILDPTGDEVVRAVRTMPNHEFRFEEFCRQNGIVVYLPLKKAWKYHNVNRGGRCYNYSREVLRPMFASYVFVKLPLPNLRSLFDSSMLTRILPVSDMPMFLRELRVVRTLETVGMGQELDVHRDIAVGDRFIIRSGIWEGVIGWLSAKDDTFRWTVQIEIANQYVTTVIDPTLFQMTRLEE